MVLWEIILGTAYFLGLKRTYKLALKIQHKLISSKHPKIRQFVQRRTRSVFDVALTIHRKIQERDIEVGRNLGNWILRWLEKMKPSAQIQVKQPSDSTTNTNIKKSFNTRYTRTIIEGFPSPVQEVKIWNQIGTCLLQGTCGQNPFLPWQ